MTHSRPTLSAIVITRNEAHNVHDCLQSMHGLVDEIIVVDSQSTDNTVEIAQQLGAKVMQPHDWPGFGPQKNRALDLATCDWVFSIDADERVTPELAAEIKTVLQGGDDYVLRLFKRGTAKFSDDLVHERVVTELPVRALQNHLLHYSYLNFSQVLSKVDAYSTASAKQAYARGKRSSVAGALGHGAWAFFRTYVIRRGFLDGGHGLALSISNAETSYYKYLKLWHMQQLEKAVKD
jgi:glycosyltransferase involved in cell wall biosynthesis